MKEIFLNSPLALIPNFTSTSVKNNSNLVAGLSPILMEARINTKSQMSLDNKQALFAPTEL